MKYYDIVHEELTARQRARANIEDAFIAGKITAKDYLRCIKMLDKPEHRTPEMLEFIERIRIAMFGDEEKE